MMTRTSLSAATPANKGNPRPALRLKLHRHSCLCAVSIWQSLRPWLPHRIATFKHQEAAEADVTSHKFLIANLELDFKLSPIRINDLKFSNRKFSAIFQFIFPSLKTPTPRSVILKASDQDARSKGSQLSPHSTPPPPAQAKFLIETPRLEIRVTSTKQNQSQFLIETNRALSAAGSHAPSPLHLPTLSTSMLESKTT